jgi:virulence-associated protein VapD
MMIMEIRFDEEKVLSEDEYDLDKMYEYLDDYFLNNGFTKKDRGVYLIDNKDKNKNFTRCGIAVNKLDKLEWFTKNVCIWNWHKPHSFYPDTMTYEDIPESLKDVGYRFPAYVQSESLIEYA